MIMMFKTKKDADKLVEKAHKIKEHTDELFECLEDAIETMEERYEDNYRRGHRYEEPEYHYDRYDYMRRMR